MAKQLQGVEFYSAALTARSISDAAFAAYWQGTPFAVDHHGLEMRIQMDRLCALMGLRLVDAEPAPRPLLNLEDA